VPHRGVLALPWRLLLVERGFGEWVVSLKTCDHTTLVDGYLGSRNDEERSEMRYVMRIAEFSESSNF